MRKFALQSFAVFLVSSVLLACAWVVGITPAGLFDGQWDDFGDHPTNLYDTTLHP
jgi:hypothetical protein